MKKNVPWIRCWHVMPLLKRMLVLILILLLQSSIRLLAEVPGNKIEVSISNSAKSDSPHFTLFLRSDMYAVITGTVTGENNQPLVGAAVKVKGTNIGVTTNEKGEFTINAADNAVLVITYVGYAEKEVSVNGQTNLT